MSDIGQRVGRYVIRGELGSGGMGRVLRGYDEKLHREVALKEVRRDRLGQSGARRLVAEARAMGKLSHPNVVALYDVLELDGDEVVLVMEYVQGETLAQWLRTPRPWQEIVVRFEQAGRGLAAAHAAGVLHRDFKPDNVMVGRDGRVRVTDFGLAREVVSERMDDSGAALDPPTLGLPPTAPGAIVGTLPYLAPERLFGAPADPSTDQFAFCVSLWEALFGERPFAGRSVVELAVAITAGPATPPVTTPPIPPRLIDTIRRGLAEHASQRWPDLDALLAALPSDRHPRRRWWPAGVAAAATALAVVVYVVALRVATPVAELHAQLHVAVPDVERAPAPVVHAEVRAAAWPPSAILYLDGTPLDGNPTVATLPPGDAVHLIEARAAGYETRTTEVVAGKDREVMLELKPPSTARSRPRRSGTRARADTLPIERESPWKK